MFAYSLRYVRGVFSEFSERYARQEDAHRELVDSFEGVLEQLRKVDLHPKLRKSGRATLLDCVSEGKLRALAQECRQHLGLATAAALFTD